MGTREGEVRGGRGPGIAVGGAAASEVRLNRSRADVETRGVRVLSCVPAGLRLTISSTASQSTPSSHSHSDPSPTRRSRTHQLPPYPSLARASDRTARSANADEDEARRKRRTENGLRTRAAGRWCSSRAEKASSTGISGRDSRRCEREIDDAKHGASTARHAHAVYWSRLLAPALGSQTRWDRVRVCRPARPPSPLPPASP